MGKKKPRRSFAPRRFPVYNLMKSPNLVVNTCLVAVALPLLLIDSTKVQRTCRGKKNKKCCLLNEKTLFFFKKLYKLLFIKNLINRFFRFC
jgi:hypothetical protein